MNKYIVSGYYTPDYAKWARPLIASLEKHAQPYEFCAIPAVDGWEAATRRKPALILKAMDRHPDKTIIWLDADCTVWGDLSPLADMPGDICLRFEMKRRKGRAVNLRAHSGTMVINPTNAARYFIEGWELRCRYVPHGGDDEEALAVSIIETPGIALTQLHLKWFAGGGRRATDPIIVHDWASRHTTKVHKVVRFFHRQIGTVRGVFPS